jgi:hypothetical protein
MRVRLLVAIDPDAGIEITPAPPIADVAPGDWYEVTTWPQKHCDLARVIVRDYVIEQLTIGVDVIDLPAPRTWIDALGIERRSYQLVPPIAVLAGLAIRACLRNMGDQPQRAWSSVLFEEPEDADDRWEPGFTIVTRGGR